MLPDALRTGMSELKQLRLSEYHNPQTQPETLLSGTSNSMLFNIMIV